MRVVADGAIGKQGTAAGRLVPVVMVDMSDHPDVAELVRVHQYLGPGDCHSQWAQGRDGLLLRLRFERPIELTIAPTFALPEKAGLVDQVLSARAIYLQHGVAGDRMSTTMHHPRLLIELPPTGFEEQWEGIFFTALVKVFRDGGLKRSEAKAAARDMIVRWRELGSIRMR
ncbi:hypothetical protein [Humibacillus xanthopallidus]|uniref:hypothetical protein n=1 Tax=Humibacillus xanthopallidus TaxID=412689 RepID=UPI001C88FB10|nr:hypothetical protein [Humibacillus xanthopallidus]